MEKPFVLIIEDERDIAALFRHIMDLAGYRTEVVSNGQLGLERISLLLPDVVLLDLTLPIVSGVQVLWKMRTDERLKHIPVVVITAHAEMARGLEVEPDLVMLKPVSPSQLTALVHRLAGESPRMQTEPFGVSPWDELTGLYNRPFFIHRLESALLSLKETSRGLFAVIALSPNQYQAIQLQQGSKAAGEFLRTLAESLKACVRPTDTIARFDGDRFFILIEQAPGLRIAEMIALRVRDRLAGLSAGPQGAALASSLGVLMCDARYQTADEIVRDAMTACALAHAAGPGSCKTFDHESIGARFPADSE